MTASTASVVNTVAANGGKRATHRVTFFQQGGRIVLTHAQLDAQAARLAHALRAGGLAPGARIGIVARNGLAWVLLDLAALKAGIVTAGFEFGKFRPDQALVDRYALDAVYADGATSFDPARDLRALVDAHVRACRDGRNGRDVDPVAPPFESAAYARDDVTTIKFTSGSSGEPKGLAARAGSIDASLAAVQQLYAHGDGDDVLVFLPLSLLQQRYWIYSALTYGHDATVAPFEFALEAIREQLPTVVMGVPGFYDGIKKRIERATPPDDTGLDARRRRIDALLGPRIRYLWTGSAPANPQTLRFFDEAGVPIFEGYGMNETCIVAKNHPGAARTGSVGRLIPGKRARIDDDGVLIVGADEPVNTQYLYSEPGASERIFLPTGEVRTGDLARFDDDGYLYILGRADDLIVLANGKNVHTRKLEEQVKAHVGVEECVLYGAGRPFLVAVISPQDARADHAAIHAHLAELNATLAPHERIVKAFIAPRPFGGETRFVTSQFKPKRNAIFSAFNNEIERLYGGQA
ncbi:AMP-dependent synthetase [Burkholderia ubonensis]|uniref:AMP-binding protein n=1 Tax=Burkholderia ubonensis TaxID=101571 RepID=UPI0007578994|nr:AMP-binding protein [Burkholderia ubonensis]KVN61900.1 AMP-dependent synthetase [Burkholderia ubonensis]KWI22173.1 AMP-dependent synthetase [Burkholderia ubonensis]KWI23068.1 AMP-dependent synthetase [Burkholderia ubonensis]ODQ39581.1 AMP-dependent synthetase [Burkholderia ubonensis]OJA29855.1 AMP-dependent synthetase [Burkholderia ubonensis]